jgi:hypothetical protein
MLQRNLGTILNYVTNYNIFFFYLQEIHGNQESQSHLCFLKMFLHHQKWSVVDGWMKHHD